MNVERCARIVACVALVVAAGSCSEAPATRLPDSMLIANLAPPATDVALSQGEGRLRVDGGRIWYRVVGNGAGTPVILLHDGPGVPGYSLKPLEALSDERPVVRYDQLGAGKSDGMRDTSRMNIAQFVNDLDSLRAHLGFETVHLLGHGWGSLLAVEYYHAHPDHVASLVLASPFLDANEWSNHARQLLRQLPDSLQRAVAAADSSQQFNTPGYRAATLAYHIRFLSLHPVAADVDSTTSGVNAPLLAHMMGASEFGVSGSLAGYDASALLRDVAVPVLYTVGQFDESNPATVRRFAAMTRGARVVVVPGAAHVTMWDNPAAMIAAVRQQLAAVDARTVSR